jgi:hypothetical protein
MRWLLWCGLFCFSFTGCNTVAHGAEISNRPDAEWAPRGNRSQPGWDITVNGAIVPGDDVKFVAALASVGKITPAVWPVIVWLNSPGGEVETSTRIADLIDRFNLGTHVDGQCASSCFIMFMAGKSRSFSPNAKIGVHSVYQGSAGAETPLSLEMTMVVIRKAQSYSGRVIPPSVIGKLAGTLGTSISWLSREELQQIGATMNPPESASVVHTPKVMQQAQIFAGEYAREKPAYAADYGGQGGVLQRWLESYDHAYSSGTDPGGCGNGSSPDSDGCRAGARDYRNKVKAQD